jgi:gliding motility-associated-like protein
MVGMKKSDWLMGFCALFALTTSNLWAQTAPTFSSSPVVSATYATQYQYDIITLDDENSTREILLSSGLLPAGITLTDNGNGTAILQGFPQQVGQFNIELKVRETGSPFLEEVQSFTLDVAKAVLTVTANDNSRSYGDSNPAFTFSITGFLNGDDANDLDVAPTASTTATAASDVGNYVITVSGGSDDVYDFSYQAGQFTIVKTTLFIQANSKAITYGDALPTLTFDYSGFLNGDDANDLNTQPTVNTTAIATSGVGTYPITVSGGSDNNYDFDYQGSDLTIGKAGLHIDADDQYIVYGEALPNLTVAYTGFVHGDDSSDLNSPPSISTTAVSTSGAGTYGISVSGGSDDNYNFTYEGGSLNIDKAVLQVIADNQTRVYGAVNPTLTFQYDGFVHDDDATDLNAEPATTTVADASSSVGSYSISFLGGSDDNYDFNFANGQLSITQAALSAIADDKAITYGEALPTLSFTYSGFVNGEGAGDIDSAPSIGTSAIATSGAGVYDITLTGGSDNNYQLTLQSASLTINKAALQISADSKTITYGQSLPTLTFSYSGFAHGDDLADLDVQPSVGTIAIATSGAGVYPITVGGSSDNNYSISFVQSTLTINKATLQVSADAKSRIYGTANPLLTYQYTGFVHGDTEAVLDILPTISTTAVLNSNVGTYPITVSGASDNNYNFTYSAAILTIVKATATIQINSLLQNVDGLPKPVAVTTTPPALTHVVLYNGSTTVPSTKGTYNVQVTIQETNYEGTQSATYMLNGPPVLLSSPSININEDSGVHQLDLSAFVDDLEQSEASLQYTIVSMTNAGLFQQAAISGVNLLINPKQNLYGSASITVRITDAQSLFVETTIPVTVNNIQDAPVFTSTPVIVGAQDVPYTYPITVTDVDLADVLTVSSIVALPSWLTLTNQGNGTATLSGTPLAANIGTSGVALKVTDDKGNSTNQFFDINVLEGQFPPEFSSSPVTTARESVAYTYMATTTDFNGGPITYSTPTLPSWLTGASNDNEGYTLSGTPGLSNVYFENGNQDFPVVIRATDNTGLFKEQAFQIRVLYENSPPTVTIPIAQLSMDEDATVVDANLTGITDGGEIGQVITITATPDPTGIVQASVTYSSPQTEAVVHLQPVLNANGITTVSIRVQDNGKPSKNFVVKTLQVTVNPVNDQPSIASVPGTRVNEGTNYSYTVAAVDPDASDNLTFQFLDAPSWLAISSVNSREASVSGTAPVGGSDATVRIRVSDPSGTFAIQEFTLRVNKAPQLQLATAETNEDANLAIPKSFFESLILDPNSDVITAFRITAIPRGQLRFKGQTLAVGSEIAWSDLDLMITYVPPLDYFGPDSFGWNVSDGLLFANTPSRVSLTVISQNDPPEIRNIETVSLTFSQGDPGVAVSSQLTLADVDDANLQQAVVSVSQSFDPATDELALVKPDGDTSPITASFNSQTGELTLTGEASKSAYETALRNVKYRNTFLGQTDELTRTLSIRVSDLLTNSATVYRDLNIIRVLPDIEIVKAFTPNGDGVNDTWDFINLIAYSDIKILVFDGSGRKVYDCRDSNCAWDGTLNGKELPSGEYLYSIDLEEGRRKYNGTVTLLK